ncbi:alkaline phosphatase family protein [Arthrobacter sp. NA-172]|uniref:alkaline phosphatase family protein n=1 Tax=Arthrobacter sp. NA-172 TaxID=3367524 RepID=UPI003754C126
MKIKTTPVIIIGTLSSVLVGGAAFAAVSNFAGPHEDGTAVTSIGMRVTPAGQQTALGDLPLNSAISPDGKKLAVTNNGQGTQSLQLVDLADHEVDQTIPYKSPESLYMGLAWSPDGTKLYASAAANSKIRTYSFSGGRLTEGAPLQLPTTTPSGNALNLFPAGLALTPDGKRLIVADQLADAVSVVDLATGKVSTTPAGHRPLSVTVSPEGTTAYVTNQGASDVSVVDISGAEPKVSRTFAAGLHPNKSVLSKDGRKLYVANGDDDTVSAVDTTSGTATSISVAPEKGAPVGTNPTGLALDEAGHRLFVSNSGNNDVAVVDLGSSTVSGVVPVGWYPSSMVFSGGTLHVTNAKGLGAGPNNGPGHPNPESTAPAAENQYSGSMIVGTLSSFEVPQGGQLQKATEQVKNNNRPDTAGGNIIPRQPGQQSPIKHVIYVVKENRTYDQVLGSLGKGNGDPSLNLFGDESAPNMRALSKKFTTLDNFYADAEVSANGWNWVASANSNPYAEQMWPANYSGRKGQYPSEGNAPEIAAQQPDNTYVWQRLAKAGVSFRNYGFYVSNNATGTTTAADPVLDAQTDHNYRGYDLNCPDSAGTFAALKTNCGTPRVDEWAKDFQSQVTAETVPTVQFVRLPNDHTQATKTGAPTPKAYVADNDYALGKLVDTVSHSSAWKDTAIFVTEDDAQNGPDHVDAHRTLALAISPYTQTGKVDSTFYSTASMVRTIGLIAGIGPLTQFDAFATPMNASFTAKPDNTSYTALKPSYDMTTVNGANAPMAPQVAAQDTATEDKIDEQLYNKAIWQSVNGSGSTMPDPKHSVIGSVPGSSSGSGSGPGSGSGSAPTTGSQPVAKDADG